MDAERPSLVELRVLEGANLYFPRAAVKLTLDISTLLALPDASAREVGQSLGLAAAGPGAAGTGLRQRFALRVVVAVVRRVARESGTSRLAVRSRPTAELHRTVVAFPWRHRDRAQALGHAVAGVLDALPAEDVDAVVAAAAALVRRSDLGDAPGARRPHVPVVAVTGTNGKTTTSRMVARMGRCAGLVVGWSSTDGVYIDGELVEPGDYSGPSGAGRVLDDPRVRLAVTETARGGILLRGLGVVHNDVSVVTNVSADHLGQQGIDTVDQLAEVKAVVTRVTRTRGWVVLNGDDPRTFAMRLGVTANVCVFSRDPESPALRKVLDEGGRAVTLIDGDITVLEPRVEPDPLVPVVDVPMTLAGLSHVNVENALAAVGAGLGVGLPRAAVVDGLRSFRPGPEDNPGRMNVYELNGVTVVVDLAHNEAGVAAVLEVLRGLGGPGASVRLVMGTPGDRTDDIIRAVGEMAARGADQVVIGHKEHYLRGRDADELAELLQEGAAAVGVHDVPVHATELAGLQALVDQAVPGDVIGVMCHAERGEIEAWLGSAGATADGPDEIRAKVLAAAAPGRPPAPCRRHR
ncbi:MAG TPA: Mur ligase family protein [Mycobacteriales bacterium]|nr:Mur ligase family protein [Mycobacteriales bacterium]